MKLSFRYVNLFLKDVKRKVNSLLQIETAFDKSKNRNSMDFSETNSSSHMSAFTKSSEIIEVAIAKYLKVKSKTFDVTKIIEVI